MHPLLRVVAISAIFGTASIGWAVLGGVTSNRDSSSASSLGREVAGLWGSPQVQPGIALGLAREREEETERTVDRDGRTEVVRERRMVRSEDAVTPASSAIEVAFDLDKRRRGLVWYDLYGVTFDATYTYVHEEATENELHVVFRFPDARGLYDDFTLEVNGVSRPEAQRPTNGGIDLHVHVTPQQRTTIHVAYRSRGMHSWAYQPSSDVGSLRDFRLQMQTNFHDVDFAEGSVSPTRRTRTASGETLVWRFRHVVTGRTISLVMPEPLQPGELAAELSFSAPISLFFFFLVMAAVAKRRNVDLHPMHFAFLAAAFFAFHLLFAYSADHLEIGTAFALASVTSVVLVLSYLRVLVSPRFAFVEAASAQLVYLVGFALAHFAEGFTGLTVTVLAILTLFLLMQWSAASERDRERERARLTATPDENPEPSRAA